ncbi:MAG: sulfotransferase [Longimicrobiales bacterium]|nr:sulfotransferase [Longimicrobiales bacterium]
MPSRRPIIIFGIGRSGTTIFHQMLAEHPNLAWLSSVCAEYPERPGLNRLVMQALDVPGLERIVRRRFPLGEHYRFWEHYSNGFSEPCRDLGADDLSHRTKRRILKATDTLTTQKRDRLLIKITGWPRTGFLSQAFEDAVFIHVLRDGRAVANSLMNVDFWRGWQGPAGWRWGPMPPEYRQEWETYDESFVVLAAIQWKLLMDAAEEAKRKLDPERLLEIRYEDLCAAPIPTMRTVSEFCDLPATDSFERRLGKFDMTNTNDKYRKDLTPGQQAALEAVLAGHLETYGYTHD